MDSRLRALCDLMIPSAREYGGRHEYDGRVQDLSPSGVDSGLAALGGGKDAAAYGDVYDEALTASREEAFRAALGELRFHRTNPLLHVDNLDVACYDRDYAPAAERAAARRRHLRAWPEAVDAAVAALDSVPAPVAEATLGAVRGLAAGLDADRDEVEAAALAAHARLVAHVEGFVRTGDPSAALGAAGLTRLLSTSEAIEVDLDALASRADAERDRLREMLAGACARIDPDRTPAELIPELLRDHPDASGVVAEAQALTEEVIAWTERHRLAPWSDGTCRVGPAPESRSWAMAMMSWSAPGEVDAPAWYYVTPPRPDWPADEQEEWLQVFSRTTLPAITVHEVAPGHFSHGLALRRAPSEPRQQLFSEAFVEGWAHYVEEVAIEEGFHAEDPRFTVGVAIEALARVTRFACALGLHAGDMTVPDAAARFERDAFLAGPAALSEARRGTFDPTYGRYTWGKLVIRDLREQARRQWGEGFDLPRFHAAMLSLGAPPLGLLDHALGAPAEPRRWPGTPVRSQ
ncbi:MAG TPA: DUF885 family protein [Mycobacteriales bacterium]